MGGVPKQHKTKSRVRQRRSHHALKQAPVFPCPNCKAPILAHRACSNCKQSPSSKKALTANSS